MLNILIQNNDSSTPNNNRTHSTIIVSCNNIIISLELISNHLPHIIFPPLPLYYNTSDVPTNFILESAVKQRTHISCCQ